MKIAKLLVSMAFFFTMLYASFSKTVTVISIDGGIGPATAMYIHNGLDEAIDTKASALIIKLNTPGGLLESTRTIASYLLDSEVPVIVYVAPGGARAGSAGVFITLAGHIAAMAPGTNIGAAHPVGLGGSSDSTVMGQKVENDAAAFVRTIAQKRNKNVDWAENAVRESISSTENEALAENVIDFISKDLDELIRQCNGKVIKIDNKDVSLNLDNVKIIYREMNWRESLLQFISNPNISYILILVGIYGLFFEFKSPGSIFPGTIGGISILLAAYSLQMMPINYVGLALIILAFILFVLEIFVISYGMLSVGGVVSFAIGSVMLIDSPIEIMRVSMGLIITASIFTALLIGIIIYFGLKAQNSKIQSGENSIIGSIGIAKTNFSAGTYGKIHVQGEIWQARTNDSISIGDKVKVIELDSMIATVIKE